MKVWCVCLLLAGSLVASTARADRTQVYSITGIDCVECSNPIQAQLHKLKGVKKAQFDKQKAELRVTMADGVSNDAVLAAIARSGPGFKGTVGAGSGAYIPFGVYPKGADVVVLASSGAAVGPLAKLRVRDKYTVFDLYADWCGPCREVDARLRQIVAHRPDVAVRKLDVVDFDSPLAREQGGKLRALPFVVVFAPNGKRTELVGDSSTKLAAALGEK